MARKRGLGENAVDTAWAKKDEILNQGCERGEEASGDETRPRRLTRKSTELDRSQCAWLYNHHVVFTCICLFHSLSSTFLPQKIQQNCHLLDKASLIPEHFALILFLNFQHGFSIRRFIKVNKGLFV